MNNICKGKAIVRGCYTEDTKVTAQFAPSPSRPLTRKHRFVTLWYRAGGRQRSGAALRRGVWDAQRFVWSGLGDVECLGQSESGYFWGAFPFFH